VRFNVGDVVSVRFGHLDGYVRHREHRQYLPFRGEILSIRYRSDGSIGSASFRRVWTDGDGDAVSEVVADCHDVVLTKEDE
tara:strand:- start:197 stop:439 length:243 start_codon:yes stop_codon:yes gene_type:complete